ncbi:hypothetical protein HDU93_003106 [Gonapodya sp. JEL0774]|nr:hypothetical protein HDU93_003106 [Gonapodya sp. JEL0774]
MGGNEVLALDIASAFEWPQCPANDLDNHQRYRGGHVYLNELWRSSSKTGSRQYARLAHLLEPKGLIRALFSTFGGEIGFPLQLIPAPIPVTVLVHSDEQSGVMEQSFARTGLVIVYAGKPTSDERQFGTFHHKLILLEYHGKTGERTLNEPDHRSFLRVIVLSANLGFMDYNLVEQLVWVQDFPMLLENATTEVPLNDFLFYLRSFLHVSCCPITWIESLAKYDFSEVSVFLIASLPGIYSERAFLNMDRWWEEEDYPGEGVRRGGMVGLGRLDTVVRRWFGVAIHESAGWIPNVKVEYASSSLGQITPDFVSKFVLASAGSLQSVGATEDMRIIRETLCSSTVKGGTKLGSASSLNSCQASSEPPKKRRRTHCVTVPRDPGFDDDLPPVPQTESWNVSEKSLRRTRSSTLSTPFRSSTFEVVWPSCRSAEQASTTIELKNGQIVRLDLKGVLCFPRSNHDRDQFPTDILRRFDSRRPGTVPHLKLCIVRFINLPLSENNLELPIGFVYVGSHNLSMSAWGSISFHRSRHSQTIGNTTHAAKRGHGHATFNQIAGDFGNLLDGERDDEIESGTNGEGQPKSSRERETRDLKIFGKNYELGVVLPLMAGDHVVVGRRMERMASGEFVWVNRTVPLDSITPWKTPLRKFEDHEEPYFSGSKIALEL